MAFLQINNVEIKAVACAVPKQAKVAKEQPFFTEIEAENFTNVTGVVSSHVAPVEIVGEREHRLDNLCLNFPRFLYLSEYGQYTAG